MTTLRVTGCGSGAAGYAWILSAMVRAFHMPASLQLEFDRRPSALRYMAHALHAWRRMPRGASLPAIGARWTGYRASARDVEDFCRIAAIAPSDATPILFLHATAFRLQMAVLTHPAFPLPIWRMLQTRNHLLWRRLPAREAQLELRAAVAGRRVTAHGIEVDLTCSVDEGEARVMDSLITFYARGCYGEAEPPSPWSAAPAVDGIEVGRWRVPLKGALRFGELTGDYNGIHLWSRYARLLGFKRAFSHPQRVLAQCLARLTGPNATEAGRLDIWLKGPVSYDTGLTLRRDEREGETRFALFSEEDERAAIVGQLRAPRPGEPLALLG
jgi:hypothetical protein